MNIQDRIKAFAALGDKIKSINEETAAQLYRTACIENKWFTEENVKNALNGIGNFLSEEKLQTWVSTYDFSANEKKVGVIMAGNIPLAGFHDFLSVLIAGHSIQIKRSSQDSVLLSFLVSQLLEIEPAFKSQIEFVEKLNDAEAIIATGSDNTSRYFNYYFASKPHIIRKNRNSVAVLFGSETKEDLAKLADDIFLYFGLGCRNVSKLYLPKGFELSRIFEACMSYAYLINDAKYGNNYDYNKAILLLKGITFLDSNYLMLREDESLYSPVSVLHYQYYENVEEVKQELSIHADKIQIAVSANAWLEGTVPFGKAQFPELTDYADAVDTLQFLATL